jgi:hypothetical protein
VRGLRGDAQDVATHAVRVLAVEDPLGGHRAERPHEASELLAAEAAEALLLLERLVMAQSSSPHPDGEPR